MKLSLYYTWECSPEAFWALYYDPEFVVRLHLEALGLHLGRGRVAGGRPGERAWCAPLRYGQRPNMPGPVRKIFGEEVVTTEVSIYDPGHLDHHLHHDAGHHGRQDPDLRARIALAREGEQHARDVPPRRPGQDLRRRADRRALH